jgi:hypothetical protein
MGTEQQAKAVGLAGAGSSCVRRHRGAVSPCRSIVGTDKALFRRDTGVTFLTDLTWWFVLSVIFGDQSWANLQKFSGAGTNCTELRCSRATRAKYHPASKKPVEHSFFDPESDLKRLPIMTMKLRQSKMLSMLCKRWKIA